MVAQSQHAVTLSLGCGWGGGGSVEKYRETISAVGPREKIDNLHAESYNYRENG